MINPTQKEIVYAIIKENQPIITALLIKYGIEKYVGCPDKIARILRNEGMVYSRKVKDKNYVEWLELKNI
jgi:hypothetical protein